MLIYTIDAIISVYAFNEDWSDVPDNVIEMIRDLLNGVKEKPTSEYAGALYDLGLRNRLSSGNILRYLGYVLAFQKQGKPKEIPRKYLSLLEYQHERYHRNHHNGNLPCYCHYDAMDSYNMTTQIIYIEHEIKRVVNILKEYGFEIYENTGGIEEICGSFAGSHLSITRSWGGISIKPYEHRNPFRSRITIKYYKAGEFTEKDAEEIFRIIYEYQLKNHR